MLSVAILLAALLAGCSDGGDGEETTAPTTGPATPSPTRNETAIEAFEDPDHHCVKNRVEPRVHAPDLEGMPWVLGQSWEYELTVRGDDQPNTKLVYYDLQDRHTHYMVGTPTREEALVHAVDSTNPMLGRIHRALYSPHESGDHADMFHFPLCDGSTWSTVFFGETFQLAASRTQVLVPGGSGEGFAIRGEGASGSVLRIDYALEAQWFTFLDLERSDGGVRMDLVEVAKGYTGPAHFLRGQQEEMVPLGGVTGLNQTALARSDGDEGAYDTLGLGLRLERTGGEGHYQLRVAAPNGTVMLEAAVGDVAGANTVERLVEVPYAEGEWTVTQVQTGVAGVAGLEVDGALRVSSIYDRSGAVTAEELGRTG